MKNKESGERYEVIFTNWTIKYGVALNMKCLRFIMKES